MTHKEAEKVTYGTELEIGHLNGTICHGTFYCFAITGTDFLWVVLDGEGPLRRRAYVKLCRVISTLELVARAADRKSEET